MNTSLHDLMNTLESDAFDAQMNIASGLRVFLTALHEEPIIQELVNTHLHRATARKTVFQRLFTLLDDNDDVRYANPHDVAIAVYLHILAQTDTKLASDAASAIVGREDLSWSRRLAQNIQEAADSTPRR